MSLYDVLDLNDVSLAASVPKKWDGIIQYKLRQLSSLQSAMSAIVLQNCESLFITTRHDLLQNATGITRCVETQTAKWPQYIDSIFCDYLIISHNSTELP